MSSPALLANTLHEPVPLTIASVVPLTVHAVPVPVRLKLRAPVPLPPFVVKV